jgi:hypothetical protein
MCGRCSGCLDGGEEYFRRDYKVIGCTINGKKLTDIFLKSDNTYRPKREHSSNESSLFSFL